MFFAIILILFFQDVTLSSSNEQVFLMIRDYIIYQNDSTLAIGYFCKHAGKDK